MLYKWQFGYFLYVLNNLVTVMVLMDFKDVTSGDLGLIIATIATLGLFPICCIAADIVFLPITIPATIISTIIDMRK